MIRDLTQELEILGKVFHFRTRRTDRTGLSIRSEVVLDGKVVAVREATFDRREERTEEVALAWMKEQHRRVLERFVARVLRYQRRGSPAAEEPAASTSVVFSPPRTPRPPPPRRGQTAPPAAASSPSLASSLRVRQFFGSFCKLIGSPSRALPPDVEERLHQASAALEWMTRSSLFAEIRVDEQVRCHLLKERIDAWLDSDRHFAEAHRIWSEVITFNNYLAEVNNRAELVAFDRSMLLWALDQVGHGGMTDEVLEHLAWIYGLFPRLNRLLEEPEGVSDAAWTARLQNALTLTDPRSTER